jgi:hypothetical protein
MICMKRLRISIVSTLVLAVVVGATATLAAAAPQGGGGDRLTKRQWIRQANGICDDYRERVAALDPPSGDPRQELSAGEFDEIADYTDQAQDHAKEALSDLRALKPPRKDTRKVKAILRPLAAAGAALGAATDAAGDRDGPATVVALTDARDHGEAFETAATAYGSTCGQPAGS